MTKNYNVSRLKNRLRLLAMGLLASVSTSSYAQLSGSKTLGTGGDYATWAALATDISSNGVNGNLTVEVISDLTSSASITLTNNATNSTSSSRTITIDGKGRKLTSNHGNAALVFNGIDYVTLKDYTIDQATTLTSVKGIQFMGGADYNTIDKVNIHFSGLTGINTSTISGGAYIVFSSSTTSMSSLTTTYNGSYNTIQNCKMTTRDGSPGPTAGIYDNGSNNFSLYTTTASNNTFKGNTIENFYFYGIYMGYTNGDQAIDNDISRNNASGAMNATSYGIFSTYSRATNRSVVIEGNHIHDLPFVGATTGPTMFYGVFSTYNVGTTTNFFKIEKNTLENIKSGTMYIGYNLYNENLLLTKNIVDNCDATTGQFFGWYNWYNSTRVIAKYNEMYNCESVNISYGISCAYGNAEVEISNNIFKHNALYQNTNTTYTRPGVAYVHLDRPSFSPVHYVNYNLIDSNSGGAYYSFGIYTNYANVETNNNQVTNNRILRSSGTAVGYWGSIYNYYVYNLRCNNNLVADNVGYYGVWEIYNFSFSSGNYKAEIRDNTIKFDGNKFNTGYQYNYNYALYAYLYYHNDIRVTGNNIDMRNGYYYYPVYTFNIAVTNYKEWEYNNYWTANSQGQFWYNPSGNGGSFAAWKNTDFGKNETAHLPFYVDEAKLDLRVNVFEMQNKVPLYASNNTWAPTENTIDFKDVKRNLVKHDHGALENYMNITGEKSDATIAATVCSGHEFTGDITIKNNFADTIYGFNVSMVSDRGAKVTQLVTDRILPGNSLKVNFTDKLILNAPGKTKVMILVDASDDNPLDDTIQFTTEVLPAPGGGRYTASAKTTEAIYQMGRPFDITILNQPVIFDVNAPTKYSNTTYGSTNDWTAEAQAYTASGRAVTGATFVAPTGTTNLEVKFVTVDATLEDSMLTLVTRVIDHNNNCDTFIKRNVFIYPTITPIFAFPAQICEGEAVLFENISKVLSGGMEFKWDFGTGVKADETDAPEPVFQFPGSQTYKVKLVAKTVPHGFTFDTTMDVTVNPIPLAAFSKINACEGETLRFTNTTVPITASMKWSFGDGTTATGKDATKKYNKPGQYNVTLEADLNGCVATVIQKVYQFDKPVAVFDKIAGTCDNDVFEFENKSTITAGLIGSLWNFDDNESVSTDNNAMYEFSNSGDKKVKLVVTSEFGCKDSMIKTINIKESPKVSFTNGPLCSVKSTEFINTTANVANAIANYRWNFGDGSTSGAKSPTHNWKGNLGPKKVSLTVTLDNGCEEIITKDMVVLTQPTPEFTAGEACSGDEISFVNNTTWAQGKISYRWDFGDGTISSNSDPVKVYNASQSFYPNVTLYAFIEGGCGDSITKTNYVLINEKPRTCDFKADVDYSAGFYGVKAEPMNASGVVGGQNDANYVWIFEGAGTLKSSGSKAEVFNNLPADGEYKITMRATMQQSGCECSRTQTIVMNRSSAEQLRTSGVAVYPNPNNGQFQVVTSETFGTDIQITVMDMNGRVVLTQSQGAVNASEMSAGMYLVRVSNGMESVTTKVQISK